MFLISPRGGGIGTIPWFQYVLLQSLVLHLCSSPVFQVFSEIEFQTKTQQPEIAPNPVTSSSQFPVHESF